MAKTYEIGLYDYGWLDQKVHTDLGKCNMCGEDLFYHCFGFPLKVCLKCYPEEGAV